LKLSITNIHIRYEDTESNLGHPFAAGLTLAKLAAVTVDEDGKEIFVTGSALDRIQKSAELNRLAFYFDPDTDPWPMEKWEELLPKEWNKVFMPGIKEDPSSIIGDKPEWIQDHQYVLEPVAGTAKYFRLGQKDSRTPDKPPQKAVVILEDVTLSLSEKQYRDAVKLMENISTFKKRVEYAHYRPNVSISADKNAWWKYTYAAITEQRRRASGHLSWEDILKYSKMRKNYVSKYIELLKANPKKKSINKNKEIQELDRQLDPKIIIQWRMLAHTYVEQERAKDAIHQQSKKSWWAFGWGSGSDESNRKDRELTEDDWKQVNEIIGYEQGKPSPMLPDVDLPNMVHSVVEIEMKHNGTRFLSGDRKVRILELTAEGIGCNVKLYPQTQVFDVKLSSYKISCPEGLLGESAMDKKSLYGTFTLHPWDREVDWMLEAKAAPCYVTVLMPSINRVTQFFSSKEAVSQRVALQTAAALQSTVNEVSKNAQHQLNDALKNKPRFLLDLDIDAPKVVIPTEFYPDGKHQCKLFLDLGHFKIRTVPVYFLRLSLSLSSSLFSPFLLAFVNDWFGKKMMGTITCIFLMIHQELNLALRHKIRELGEKRILCSSHQIGYLPLVLLLKSRQLLRIVACLLDCKRRMDHWITAHRRRNCTCDSV
jgi:vacuolar protein sorting-associated protein 13A/C